MKIASKLYNSPVAKLPAYVSKGHVNYLGFILSIINFVTILYGIVLERLKLSPIEKWIVIIASAATLLAASTALGWIDIHALSSRKSDEEVIYWRRPSWKILANMVYRYNSLPAVALQYNYAANKTSDPEIREKAINCLREIASKTIDWCYTSRDVQVHVPTFNGECLKVLVKHLDDIDLSDDLVKELERINYERMYR